MSNLTNSDKQYVKKRVAEKYQYILEEMVMRNMENCEDEYYNVSEKLATIVLSEFYHDIWIHWHEKAFRYLSQGKDKKSDQAWGDCAKAIYAYYIVETKYKLRQ